MQLQSPNDVVPLSGCWPLARELSLPKTLIGPDYLEEVFFRALPARFNCSAAAIRKALKLFLKRTVREAYRTLPSGSGISDRDRELATLACNEPRARERIRELEITVEAEFSRFGRQVFVAMPLAVDCNRVIEFGRTNFRQKSRHQD
jgi:hypothetical protein